MALSISPFPSLSLLSTTPLPILIIFVPLISSTSSAFDHHQQGLRVGLTHIAAGKNLTKLQLIQHSINGRWFSSLSSHHNSTIQAPTLRSKNGGFLVNLSIGTPAIPFLGIMDTESDLIWTSCKPHCVFNCSAKYRSNYPLFDPKNSSSSSNISCSSKLCRALEQPKCEKNGCKYMTTYQDESSSEGYMVMDTFSFKGGYDESGKKTLSLPNIGFGCGVKNEGKEEEYATGIVGLGRGPLSLVSQLGSKKFSYCLSSKNGSLLFGSLANLNYTNCQITKKSTPLIHNPNFPSFYYLSLQAISIGGTLLPIPKSVFNLTEDGYGGMIIDSGTTITLLQEDAFEMVKNEFIRQMKNKKIRVSNSSSAIKGLEVCFDLPSRWVKEVGVPEMVFHFKGLDLKLPSENYMVADSGLGVICLAMGPTGSFSILGNFQQQNMLVLHDLDKEALSFIPTNCHRL